MPEEKLAQALYIEDCFVLGAKPKPWHEVAKLDRSTYVQKAKRINATIGKQNDE